MHWLSPLTGHLKAAPVRRIVLTFDQIETIVRRPLIASAREHGAFWSNSTRNAYSIAWRAAGFYATRRGVGPGSVAFERPAEARDEARSRRQSVARPPASIPSARERSPDVVLVGCVKTKASEARPAKDLYRSPLFRRRRDYAERRGKSWFILSAAHGLLAPDTLVAPYDRRMAERSAASRAHWGNEAVEALKQQLGPLEGRVIEIHASRDYVLPLRDPLRRAGASVQWPVEGLRLGEHLAWYRQHLAKMDAPCVSPRGERIPKAAPRPLSREITEVFCNGELDLSRRPRASEQGWQAMPEVKAVTLLRKKGWSNREIRLFLTFTSAMDRARSADLLWKRATDLAAEVSWAFDPEQITLRSIVELRKVLRLWGVSQRHRADADAWRRIAASLAASETPAAIRQAIDGGRSDATALLQAVSTVGANGRPMFPFLRGAKVAPMWIRILAYPGRARINRLEHVPVAVDVQVRKVTEYLGATETSELPLARAAPIIRDTWFEQVSTHGAVGPKPLNGKAVALDPALWFFGKLGCTSCERRGRREPIARVCEGCRFGSIRSPRTCT